MAKLGNNGLSRLLTKISDWVNGKFNSLATVATSGSYDDLSNKPTSMTPSSHTHGNITNAGAIGTTANKPLITTTDGVITTGSFGTTANTFCQGNDSRLSDARTPTSHTHDDRYYTETEVDTKLNAKANDNAVVHTSGNETITGNKYFNENYVDVNGYRFRIKGLTQEIGAIPTDRNAWNGFSFVDKNGKSTFTIENGHLVNGNTMLNFSFTRNLTDSTLFNYESVRFIKDEDDAQKLLKCGVYPTDNNKFPIGSSSLKWADVYATTLHGELDGNSSTATTLETSRSLWGNSFDGSQNLSGNIEFTNNDLTGVVVGVKGKIGSNDYWRVGGGATATNAGFLEIASADDSNEPIYVRQYKGAFTTVNRTATLLDADGNTQFPGTVTATTFSGNLTGNCSGTAGSVAWANVSDKPTIPSKTSDLTNDSHQSITVGTDTTSTASPAHSGTFTCVDSVTRDSNGHVTAINTKTVKLPGDNNTDTLVTQNVSTANENHPILLSATKDATANQGAKTSIFASGVKVNPSTNTITATTFSGALSGNASSATQFSANKSVTLTGDVTGTASSKAGWSVATTLADSGVTAGTYGPSADVTGNNNTTISVPQITVDAKGRVTSVVNKTLTCKNNTYTVNNKTLTIQKNGSKVATFTANSGSDVTCNITVPTKTSELTNNSGFVTSNHTHSEYDAMTNAEIDAILADVFEK